MAGTDAANKQTQDSGAPVFYSQASDSGIVDILAAATEPSAVHCADANGRIIGLAADEHYRIAVSYMQQEEYDRAIERLDPSLTGRTEPLRPRHCRGIRDCNHRSDVSVDSGCD